MSRPREFKPDQVLDKAVEAFWERGYEATTIQDLVERTGINRFSLYGTFGAKREIFLAALDRYCDQSLWEPLARMESSRDGVAAIREYFAELVDCYASDPGCRGCLMANALVESGPRDGELQARMAALQSRVEEAFYRTLRRARQRGELGAGHGLRELARFLTGLGPGLAVLARGSHDRERMESFVRVALSALSRSFDPTSGGSGHRPTR